MRALLDTHTFLWLTADEGQLSQTALAFAKDPSNELLFSLASAWEIAIKFGRGNLKLQGALDELLVDAPKKLLLRVLPIEVAHLIAVASLPPHHGDPFDRLLVAQSMVEKVPILGSDNAFDAYGVTRIW